MCRGGGGGGNLSFPVHIIFFRWYLLADIFFFLSCRQTIYMGFFPDNSWESF